MDGGGLGPTVGCTGGSAAVSFVGGTLGGIGEGDLVAWREQVTVMSTTAIRCFWAMPKRMVVGAHGEDQKMFVLGIDSDDARGGGSNKA